MEWKKKCPRCDGEQIYGCKSSFVSAINKNTICNPCRVKLSSIYNNIFERKCPACDCIMKYTCRQSLNVSKKCNAKCRKCATKESANLIDRSFQKTEEYRKKMSESIKSSEKSKNKFTEEVREKLRIAKLNQIKKLGTKYTYNPNACKFIEEFGRKVGYNFQHALNGGEVMISGYSLDGYDKEKNIVFEYDEPKHNKIENKKKDKIREQRIIQKLNPTMFIRYNEEFNTLYDMISGKEIL